MPIMSDEAREHRDKFYWLIAREYRAGASARDIAAHHGITVAEVYKACRAMPHKSQIDTRHETPAERWMRKLTEAEARGPTPSAKGVAEAEASKHVDEVFSREDGGAIEDLL